MVAAASILQPPETPLETEECAAGALLGGKYRLDRLVGEGGMANVWLARNEVLDLPVALKIVRPQIRGSETAARLLTEARVQANLRHPNVVRVYDYGQTRAGDAFIVMELLEGYSLAEWLERDGALSPVLAVQIMLPVIDALCAAHRAGVVHRDLKPDNIFISHPSSDLCPKLLDFGIAKLNTEFNPRLTGQGGVVGSPAYMAPEQARGLNDVDERVDVWAACVVLYETITGKPAFDGSNHLALMLAVIEEELAPLTSADCEDLWPILAAGLVKEREGRTSSMLQLGGQLAKWLAARGAAQDLGGEPVHWRYAFSASDADAVAPHARPRSMAANTSRAPVNEDSHGVASNRFSSADRHASSDRRSRTPLAAVRHGLRTLSTSPSAVRRAAALRLALAACVGGGLLVLGMSQGPLSWLAPKPESAFALAEGEKPEPHIAQPATPAQLAHMNPAKSAPASDTELQERAPLAAASQLSPADASAAAVLTQNVRSQPDFTQSARYSQAASARPHPVAARANREPAEHGESARARAQTELASSMDLKAAPPAANASKARGSQTAALARSAATASSVSPRGKSAASQPSEAELGLKNPW